jgi:hypothetical protein
MMVLKLDKYTLQARLYPAFLVLLPVFITGVFYITDFEKYYHYFTALLSVGLFTYLLAQLGRDRGKIKELDLFTSWGGKPSIQVLRHSDKYLDKITKARYHKTLEDKIPGINIPTEEAEKEDPKEADQIYESCTKFMISKTRDAIKFPLLLKENISYGFRRNLWGMKVLGISLVIICIIIHSFYATTSFTNFHVKVSGNIALYGFFICELIFWIFIVTKKWIRIPAYAYAERLFEAINEI